MEHLCRLPVPINYIPRAILPISRDSVSFLSSYVSLVSPRSRTHLGRPRVRVAVKSPARLARSIPLEVISEIRHEVVRTAPVVLSDTPASRSLL